MMLGISSRMVLQVLLAKVVVVVVMMMLRQRMLKLVVFCGEWWGRWRREEMWVVVRGISVRGLERLDEWIGRN